MTARETIYQALFGMVTPLLAPGATLGGPVDGQAPGTPTSAKPFNVVSREVIEVQRVPPLLQPVLFMDEAMEDYVRDGRGLLHHRWTVYFHVGCTSTPGTAASTILNPLIDTLEAALTPDAFAGSPLGLGNLIEHAQLSGLSIKNLGNNSTEPDYRQAVAYVPFEIVFA